MSPKLNPPHGVRYHVVVTEIHDDGTDIAFDHTGDAYIVAVAVFDGTRITGDVDHDGTPMLRHRLAAYINNAISRV